VPTGEGWLFLATIIDMFSRKVVRWAIRVNLYAEIAIDDAPIESFFHTLKVERTHRCFYATREQACKDLFACIEGWYNSHRLHSAIGYQTTAEI